MKKLLLLLLLAGMADASYYYTPITNTNDLVGWWHLDNDTTLGESNTWVYDSSPQHSGGGTLNASDTTHTTTNGYYGGGLNVFENGDTGILQGVTVSTNGTVYKPANFTITAWVKTRVDYINDQIIFGAYNSTGVDDGYFLGFTSTNRLRLCIYNNTGVGSCGISGNNAWSANAWYFVAGRFNGSNADVYVNGQHVGTTKEIAGVISHASDSPQIGDQSYGVVNSFNGTIDEVMFWNRSLTDAEVLAQYLSDVQLIEYPPVNTSRTPYMQEAAGGRPLQAIRNVFTDLMGGLFYALILGVLWVAAWLRLRNYVFPTVMLDILLFAYFWDLMPAEVQTAIYAINALVFGSVLLRLMTPVYSE